MDLIKCKWCGILTHHIEGRECGSCAGLRRAVDRDRELVRRMLKDADGCVIRNEAFEEEVKAVAKKQDKTMIEVAAAMFGVSPAFLDCADRLSEAAEAVQLRSSAITRSNGAGQVFWDRSFSIDSGSMLALSSAVLNYKHMRSKA